MTRPSESTSHQWLLPRRFSCIGCRPASYPPARWKYASAATYANPSNFPNPLRYWSWASSSLSAAWTSRLSLSAGARTTLEPDLAPAEDLLGREGLTAASKEAAAKSLPSAGGFRDEPAGQRAAHVEPDHAAELVSRLRAPEGGVAG